MGLFRVALVTILAVSVRGLDVAAHTRAHRRHRHRRASAGPTSAPTAATGVPSATNDAPPAAKVRLSTEGADSAGQAQVDSMVHLDSAAQEMMPEVVGSILKAAAKKSSLDELDKTKMAEGHLLKGQEELLATNASGLDRSALEQEVESTKTMLQELDGKMAAQRQEALQIVKKALVEAKTVQEQASSEEQTQVEAEKVARHEVEVAKEKQQTAKKVIDEGMKVLDVFADGDVTITGTPQASQDASEPQELS
ncbi:unnamed protein product [Effrenium voratum]|uniref:Uncharacterized protein n=1 Tax=Effrenium voratum TaxID=2562239 RepID=A0AA36J1U7_9DINO|nr:unnamed protein product [Effrenium voratum]CAJ1449423.1 unnamed protein product [Effrenium voratum]